MRQVNEFNIGDILRTAFWIYARHFPVFFLISLIGYLPVYFATDYSPGGYYSPSNWLGWLLDAVVSSPWQYAALTYAVVRIMRSGRAGSPSETVGQAVLAFPRVLLVGVLAGGLVLLGSMLLLVPGIILALMFFVAPPVAVVERHLASALRRSHELTQGHKGAILGLFALILLLEWVVPWSVISIVDVANLGPYLDGVLGLALGGFYVAVAAVAYHDLRILKDGPDRSVAQVFD